MRCRSKPGCAPPSQQPRALLCSAPSSALLTGLFSPLPQGRICRKAGKSKKSFSRKEAEATFKSLVKTHEKYGWVTPPVSDG